MLAKPLFLSILSNYTRRKTSRFIEFLNEIPFFKHWSHSSIIRLPKYFTHLNFYRKQSLYCEGDPFEYLFIVESGEFKLSKSVLTGTKSIIPYKTPHEPGFSGKVPLRLHGRTISLQGSVDLVIKGQNEIIGIEEITANEENHRNSCQCYSTTATVYRISKTVTVI